MDVVVREVEPSRTAVVKAPFDVTKIVALWDPVRVYLRGGRLGAPGGRIAVALHTTGYADLHVTYDAIAAWCAANGHATTGDTWEVHGDPDERDHVDVEVAYLLA